MTQDAPAARRDRAHARRTSGRAAAAARQSPGCPQRRADPTAPRRAPTSVDARPGRSPTTGCSAGAPDRPDPEPWPPPALDARSSRPETRTHRRRSAHRRRATVPATPRPGGAGAPCWSPPPPCWPSPRPTAWTSPPPRAASRGRRRSPASTSAACPPPRPRASSSTTLAPRAASTARRGRPGQALPSPRPRPASPSTSRRTVAPRRTSRSNAVDARGDAWSAHRAVAAGRGHGPCGAGRRSSTPSPPRSTGRRSTPRSPSPARPRTSCARPTACTWTARPPPSAITAALTGPAGPGDPDPAARCASPTCTSTPPQAQRVLDRAVTPALAGAGARGRHAAADLRRGAGAGDRRLAGLHPAGRRHAGRRGRPGGAADGPGRRRSRPSAARPQDARFEVSGGSVHVVPSEGRHGHRPRAAGRAAAARADKAGANRTVTAELGPVPAAFTTEQATGARHHREGQQLHHALRQPGQRRRTSAWWPRRSTARWSSPVRRSASTAFTGPRGTAQGYVPAAVISGGQLSKAVGGGISQFATTMFNAMFFAGLAGRAPQDAQLLHQPLPGRPGGDGLRGPHRPAVEERQPTPASTCDTSGRRAR